MAHTTRLVLACIIGSAALVAQQPEAPGLQHEGTLGAQPTTSSQSVLPESETPITPGRLIKNIVYDQKPIFTFPWRVAHGNYWKPVLAVTLATAALVATDPYSEPYFHDRSFSAYKTGPLRGRNSTIAIMGTPAAFYLVGLARHRPHSENTGLLAAEAIADTQILSFALKQAIGRSKPSDIPTDGNFRDTWFKYKGSLSNGGSFPSGHAASAFAVATVIASRYRERRWIPWVAYGAAAFIALSRLPDQAHFPSDIFFGAALGYGIGHMVVLNK